MKKYVCDSCGEIIDNPYEVKMKEFTVISKCEIDGVYPEDAKIKQKIHLCDKCFRNLKKIGENTEAGTDLLHHLKIKLIPTNPNVNELNEVRGDFFEKLYDALLSVGREIKTTAEEELMSIIVDSITENIEFVED